MMNFDQNSEAKKPYSLLELNRVVSISGLTQVAGFSGGFGTTIRGTFPTTTR